MKGPRVKVSDSESMSDAILPQLVWQHLITRHFPTQTLDGAVPQLI